MTLSFDSTSGWVLPSVTNFMADSSANENTSVNQSTIGETKRSSIPPSVKTGSLKIAGQSLTLTYDAEKNPIVNYKGTISSSFGIVLKSVLTPKARQGLTQKELRQIALLIIHLTNKDFDDLKLIPETTRILKVSTSTQTDWFKQHILKFKAKNRSLIYRVSSLLDEEKVEYKLNTKAKK